MKLSGIGHENATLAQWWCLGLGLGLSLRLGLGLGLDLHLGLSFGLRASKGWPQDRHQKSKGRL